MAWKNRDYRGPDIMIWLMRTTNIPWQMRSMRNGMLISKAQYNEKYPGNKVAALRQLFEPTVRGVAQDPRVPGTAYQMSDRALRNLHSGTSDPVNREGIRNTYSNYVSMTSSWADTNWGQGPPSRKFRFQIWRSDCWKGSHDLTRDPALLITLVAQVLSMPPAQRAQYARDRTPADWDRGAEFEWIALGGTRIYNVHEYQHGAWVASVPTNPDIDFWWDALV
ncbi:MAG: hypothetical protein ABI907_03300 [Ramlibacter sp.]